MIDIHFHALPGIDDGPEDWDEAVALCRAAAAEGTEAIVATPHVLRDPWLNEDAGQRATLLAELNARLAGTPRLLPGCELWYAGDTVELVEKGSAGPVTPLAGSRYVLIEFSPGFLPPGVDAAFHELLVAGVVPVIAHPERNLAFARQPALLGALVARGAKVQVTAGSILGEFGRGARGFARSLLDEGLVHVVASDAHETRRRPPRMAAAREVVLREWGEEAAEGLFVANPQAVLEDRPMRWGPSP